MMWRRPARGLPRSDLAWPAGIPVSVVVMTRNEAANLPVCLAALGRFAEVFVVDSASTDGTAEIARRCGAQVVPFCWNRAYPKKKQWCLDHLPFRHDWVLFVDADELVTPELAEEIGALMVAGPRCAGYFVEGRPVFLGRPLRFGFRNRKLALVDRRRARFDPADDLDVAQMWEVEGHYQPRLDGAAGRLSRHLWHWDRKPLFHWFDRHNRYSDWEAALRGSGTLAVLARHEAVPRRVGKWLLKRVPFRALGVFLYGYVIRLGFLDGRAGLDFAVARAFYYWQVGVKQRALARTPACISPSLRDPRPQRSSPRPPEP